MPVDTSQRGVVRLTGDAIELLLGIAGGGIRCVRNLATGHVLCDAQAGPPPILWDQRNHSLAPAFIPRLADVHDAHHALAEATVDVDRGADAIVVRWAAAEPGLAASVRYALAGDGAIHIHPAVTVGDALPPECLTFPILPDLQPLEGDGTADVLLYPGHSGWLIPNPLGHRLEGRYPNGLEGLSLQMLAYYAPGKGGFYVATHDPHATQKLFRFARRELSIRHDAWDVRRGADLDPGYPVVIAALTRGDWHEAAERYRSWAVANAPWTRRGPVANRPDEEVPRWLYEEVGLNVWGPPASVDWSRWYRHYASVVDTPLHITAGWDWPATRPGHVGREGWFPARIHPANREAWAGHRVTPYLNDIFVSMKAERFMEDWEPNLVLPYRTFPFTSFSEPPIHGGAAALDIQDPAVTADVAFFVCPATPALKELHTWRNLELVGRYELDGVYYDISSACGFAQRCLRADHGHPPGAGRAIMDAYDELNRRTRAAGIERFARCPAQGTEGIVETLIAHLDFYVARACAGPAGALEAYSPAPEEPPGTGRELVPLFQAVYHDYGPVHQDGWAQLSHGYGEIFYWVAARIVLQWGGLLSLEYAINRPERFAADDPAVTFVGWDGGLYSYDELPELDRDKARFCNELAHARTGFARPYLAYGRMLRPLPLGDVPSIEADYRRDYDAVIAGGKRAGTWPVPQVLEGAWRAPGGRAGAVLVNLHAAEPITLALQGNTDVLWGLDAAGAAIERVDRDGRARVGTVAADGTISLTLTLPPRRVVLVELDTRDERWAS